MSQAGEPTAIALSAPNGGVPGERLAVDVASGDDWHDIFYLNAFLRLSMTDQGIARRKLVWIKRFLANRGKPDLGRRMAEILRAGHCESGELEQLTVRARAELSMADKRRFVYNLAQLFQSRGTLSDLEYGRILDMAEQLGVPDTESDAMLHSVHRINDTFFAVLGLLACGIVIYLTRSVVIPLVIAIFLTMIISRVDGAIASALKVRRLRWLTKLAAVAAILAVVFGLVMVAVVSGADVASRLPEYGARLQTSLHDSALAQKALAWLGDNGVLAQLKQLPLGTMVTGFLASFVGLLSDFMLVVIFTGFLVTSSSAFTGVMAEMNKKTGAYISTKSLVSLLTGVVVFLLCWAFGIDFALFWALIAFLFNYIPVVGAVAASVPPILLSIIQLQSWTAIVAFALSMILAGTLLGQVIEPKLMGNRLAIKPVAVLFGLIFWGMLWGIPGMFLATPLMVLLRILASHFNFSRSFERLLATETT